MERAEKRFVGREVRMLGSSWLLNFKTNQRINSQTHLPRCLIGECDAQNLLRKHPLCDEMENPMCDNARLAGPRARNDHEGAVDCRDGAFLGLVECVQVTHVEKLYRCWALGATRQT